MSRRDRLLKNEIHRYAQNDRAAVAVMLSDSEASRRCASGGDDVLQQAATPRIKVLIAMQGVFGGTLRHLDSLLRYADPQEFDVHLAVSAETAPQVRADFDRWRAAGWRVHEIPMQRTVSPFADARAFLKLLRLCRRERFDIVHTHCAKAGFLGRLAAKLTGARTIHTPHLFPFSHEGGDLARGLYLKLERLAARWTDRFILLSNYQINLLMASGLAEPERAVIIPNGIEAAQFQAIDRSEARRALGIEELAQVVLFAGRLVKQKGLDVLLEAASLLARPVGAEHALPAPLTGPALRILIVGDGPLAEWLSIEIAARRLSQIVTPVGPTDQMAQYYAACDLVVMPSRVEGMSYVMLESKAAGRPLVASLASGMEEFVRHGEDGFLVPPENPDALARTIADSLSDRARLQRMGRAVRDGFSPDWDVRRNAEHTFDLSPGATRMDAQTIVGQSPRHPAAIPREFME